MPSVVTSGFAPGEYRVEVEPITEPPGEVAVYRVRVRTVGERPVYMDLGGGQITRQAVSRPEPGGDVWRADVVIVATLRVSSRPGAGQELECRLANGGAGITFTNALSPGVGLAGTVEVTAGFIARACGRKQLIARLNGQAVEVWAE